LWAYRGLGALTKNMKKYIIGGRAGSSGLFEFWDPPHISGMAEARDNILCAYRWVGALTNENYAKVGHNGSGRGHVA